MDHAALAEELHLARLERRTVERLTDRYPGFSKDDAYAVQRQGLRLRSAAGESIIGGKLGFTSRAMQQAMGVDSPNYGMLTDAMVVHDRTVDLASLIHPKVEPEIAFLLGDDLSGPDVGAATVLAATAAVLPCLEVVDSRYRDFSFAANDNVADNSSAGLVGFADAGVEPAVVDLASCGVVVSVDGEVRFTAAAAAVLDHPAAAVAWMVRALDAVGEGLGAGHLVISGGLTAPVDLHSGSTVVVEIDRLGSAELHCREQGSP